MYCSISWKPGQQFEAHSHDGNDKILRTNKRDIQHPIASKKKSSMGPSRSSEESFDMLWGSGASDSLPRCSFCLSGRSALCGGRDKCLVRAFCRSLWTMQSHSKGFLQDLDHTFILNDKSITTLFSVRGLLLKRGTRSPLRGTARSEI